MTHCSKLLSLTLVCCMAGLFVAAESRTSKALPPADEKQRVLDLEQEWVAAEIKHNATTLRRILDDRFVASFGAEKPIEKEAFIHEKVKGSQANKTTPVKKRKLSAAALRHIRAAQKARWAKWRKAAKKAA